MSSLPDSPEVETSLISVIHLLSLLSSFRLLFQCANGGLQQFEGNCPSERNDCQASSSIAPREHVREPHPLDYAHMNESFDDDGHDSTVELHRYYSTLLHLPLFGERVFLVPQHLVCYTFVIESRMEGLASALLTSVINRYLTSVRNCLTIGESDLLFVAAALKWFAAGA